MPSGDAFGSALAPRIEEVAATIHGGVLAVSVYDYLSGLSWAQNGDRWFHAASIIKVALLAAVFDAIDAGRFAAESRLHVRNRFLSAIDREPFRVDPSRDADAVVHAAVGRTMRVGDLARHMIVSSSNLAANLLFDLIGRDQARLSLE